MQIDRIDPKDVIVTTADLKEDYYIIGPIYFQINNAGKSFINYRAKYTEMVNKMRSTGQSSFDQTSNLEMFNLFFGDMRETGVGHASFDEAFFIAVEELKVRAALLGADAIIGMRQDLDLDTNGWQHFYLQVYGTAVQTVRRDRELFEQKEREKQIEEENSKQNEKEKAERLASMPNSFSASNKRAFIAYCKDASSVNQIKNLWQSFDKRTLPGYVVNNVDEILNSAIERIKTYGRYSVDISELVKQIERSI